MTKTKQAVSQQEDSNLSIKTAQLGKQIASFLVPDYMDGQKLAIVDEGVLEYLKDLLPKASRREIVDGLIAKLVYINDYEKSLADAVDVCRSFVAFHETVNLLKRYFDPKVVVTRDEPFNAEPKPLTFKEMLLKRELMANEMQDLDATIMSHPDYESNRPSLDELNAMLKHHEMEIDSINRMINDRHMPEAVGPERAR